MVDLAEVRAIVLSLPETSVDQATTAFSVRHRGKLKGLAWVWMERIHPQRPRVPNRAVLAIRVFDQQDKDMWLASRPEAVFTESHYAGYPAVLVRLAAIELDDLRELLVNAWRCQAPPALVKAFDQQRGPGQPSARPGL